jgi:hypothetical protein
VNRLNSRIAAAAAPPLIVCAERDFAILNAAAAPTPPQSSSPPYEASPVKTRLRPEGRNLAQEALLDSRGRRSTAFVLQQAESKRLA